MNNKKLYSDFSKIGNTYIARQSGDASKLPPGVYSVTQDQNTGILYFNEIQTRSDDLVKLPSQEFSSVVDQIEVFLKPETKKLFDDYGFLYKRSALLYGDPGTGKTCIVNQVAEHVKKAGGVVLFNPNPFFMGKAITQINDVQPETTVLVIFEELDNLLLDYEGQLLSMLDGEVQKSNIIYMATTNHIDKIPPRIRRPGRFSNLVEVGYPNLEVRKYYLNTKLSSDSEAQEVAEKTDGLTIDELKELLLSVKCLDLDFNSTLKRIKDVRKEGMAELEEEEANNIESEDPDDIFRTERSYIGGYNTVNGKKKYD